LRGEAATRVQDFFRSFSGAARPLLLLDYDGTLAPFRIDRFKARPWAGVPTLLEQIQSQQKTQIVVVTGRPAREIAPLLGVKPQTEVWGLHGAERLHADGRFEAVQIPPETRAHLDTLCAQLRRNSFGGLFEQKPNAVVVHWRGASSAKARIIETQTRALLKPLAEMDGLRLLEFEAGLELRTGRDKGEAVNALLEENGLEGPHPVAFLGDDLTDEAAFRALKGRGLGVLVRRQRRPTAADVWLKPPGQLKEFLKQWWRACRGLEIVSSAARSGAFSPGRGIGATTMGQG
jgi:trehalose 6-phosphate phosphatase